MLSLVSFQLLLENLHTLLHLAIIQIEFLSARDRHISCDLDNQLRTNLGYELLCAIKLGPLSLEPNFDQLNIFKSFINSRIVSVEQIALDLLNISVQKRLGFRLTESAECLLDHLLLLAES